MKKINISTNKHPNTFALVDDADHEEMNQFKWHASMHDNGKLYVQRNVAVGNKQKKVSMHTEIMGKVEGKEIDHCNGITLDNQRHNLRHCTRAENQRNAGSYRNNTSGYKGVSWHRGIKKWAVSIRRNSKLIHLGYFTCLIKAAESYDEAAIKYHGEFARLNIIQPANNNKQMFGFTIVKD